MKTQFRKSFVRDLKKIKDRAMLDRIAQVIEEVEAAAGLQDIAQLKKMHGAADCFRIRVGDHHIGVVLKSDTLIFVRCLPRPDLYKFFP